MDSPWTRCFLPVTIGVTAPADKCLLFRKQTTVIFKRLTFESRQLAGLAISFEGVLDSCQLRNVENLKVKAGIKMKKGSQYRS